MRAANPGGAPQPLPSPIPPQVISHPARDVDARVASFPRTSTRELAIDGVAIVAVSAWLCAAASNLLLMTVCVPLVLGLRVAAYARWGRGRLRVEVAFLTLCTLLGAFNDWNSVVNHRVYDYTVPVYFPELTTIPIWMLLFWGLILRFFVTLGTWEGLGDTAPTNETRLGPWRSRSPWLKVLVQLALVLVTRQAIYQTTADPIGSWVPFLLAGALYVVLFGLTRVERKLALVVLVVGPLVEVLYIQVGGLHHYKLGWLGGVPVWIALWWVLAVMVWRDLGQRVWGWLASTGTSARPHRAERRAGRRGKSDGGEWSRMTTRS